MVLRLLVCVQGDPSCRRSALLKDDSLLEFYYKDTRTYYDMFQRGLRIAGNFNHNTSMLTLQDFISYGFIYTYITNCVCVLSCIL